MARLRKEKGRFYAVFYDPNRRPQRKTVTLRTSRLSIARSNLAAIEKEVAEGRKDPWKSGDMSGPCSVEELIERYIKDKPSLRPKSRVAYRTVGRGMASLLPAGATVDLVSTKDLQRYIFDRAITPTSRVHRYRHLAAVFKWAVRRGFLSSNLFADLDSPRPERKIPVFLSQDQFDRLVAAIRDGDPGHAWLADAVTVAAFTGLRRGEIANLRWADIDLGANHLTVRNRDGFSSKSGHERVVPLAPAVAAVFAGLVGAVSAPDSPVFLADAARMSKLLKKHADAAGLPEGVHFHTLRHTCASWMVQRGCSLSEVQWMLGHGTVHMAQRYAHLAPEALARAVTKAFG